MNAKALDSEEVDDELTAALEDDAADDDDDDTTAIDTIPVPRKAPSLALIRSLAAARPSVQRPAAARVRSRVPASEPPPEHDTSILPPAPAEPSEPFHLRPTAPAVGSEATAGISAVAGPASVAPVAWTERPPALSNDQRAKVVFAGAGLLAVLGGVFWMLIVSGSVALGTRRSSTLVVTTSGSDPSGGVEIFIDGTRQCREFPCRLDDLSRGAHLLHLATPARAAGKAPGSTAVATRVAEASGLPESSAAEDARVEPNRAVKNAASSMLAAGRASAPLSPVKAARAAAKPERSNEKPSDDTGAESASAIPRGIAAVLAKSFPAPEPDAPASSNAAPAVDGKGVLTLSASPRANVAVDGRPLGATPKSIRVAPGSHTVVFASGARRSVQRVVVKPGKTARLGVRF